jgi:hypothetical protein
MASGRTTHLQGKPGHTLCGERAYPDTIVDSPKDATCFYCVTAWEKANNAGSMYSRHLHASYSYDRRRVAEDATAAKPPKVQPIAPREETEKVVHLLVEAQYIVKEWTIHSNPDFAMGHEYGATPKTYQTVSKLRDELDALTEKIRRLHPAGVL